MSNARLLSSCMPALYPKALTGSTKYEAARLVCAGDSVARNIAATSPSRTVLEEATGNMRATAVIAFPVSPHHCGAVLVLPGRHY